MPQQRSERSLQNPHFQFPPAPLSAGLSILPKVKKSEGKAMTEKDMDKFLDEIDKFTDKWRAAFLMLPGTGLRIGELLSFKREDLFYEGKSLPSDRIQKPVAIRLPSFL